MSFETLVALGGLLVAAITLLLSSRRDTRGDAAQRAQTTAKLDSIAHGVDDLRVDSRALRSDLSKMAVDLARVDQSARSAHHRIDDLQQHIHGAASQHDHE